MRDEKPAAAVRLRYDVYNIMISNRSSVRIVSDPFDVDVNTRFPCRTYKTICKSL